MTSQKNSKHFNSKVQVFNKKYHNNLPKANVLSNNLGDNQVQPKGKILNSITYLFIKEVMDI